MVLTLQDDVLQDRIVPRPDATLQPALRETGIEPDEILVLPQVFQEVDIEIRNIPKLEAVLRDRVLQQRVHRGLGLGHGGHLVGVHLLPPVQRRRDVEDDTNLPQELVVSTGAVQRERRRKFAQPGPCIMLHSLFGRRIPRHLPIRQPDTEQGLFVPKLFHQPNTHISCPP